MAITQSVCHAINQCSPLQFTVGGIRKLAARALFCMAPCNFCCT